MSINRQSDVQATLQIGPTTEGMVRLYVEGDGVELPMDFNPDEAEEIAEELRSAARLARGSGPHGGGGGAPARGGQGGRGGPRKRR